MHDDEEQGLRDRARTEVIERLGWEALRVTNDEVLGDLDAVFARIRRAAWVIRGA